MSDDLASQGAEAPRPVRANVSIHIKFQTIVPDNPDAYEGAETPAARMAKEQDYLAEAGDYLFQALALADHEINVKVTPIDEYDEGLSS